MPWAWPGFQFCRYEGTTFSSKAAGDASGAHSWMAAVQVGNMGCYGIHAGSELLATWCIQTQLASSISGKATCGVCVCVRVRVCVCVCVCACVFAPCWLQVLPVVSCICQLLLIPLLPPSDVSHWESVATWLHLAMPRGEGTAAIRLLD